MSPRKFHGFTCSNPLFTHSLTTLTNFSASSFTSPIQNILEESEKYPLYIVETSTLIISPFLSSTSFDGIPWHT
ncbi:hypothetical protein D3C73_1374820 [compost metagenome]